MNLREPVDNGGRRRAASRLEPGVSRWSILLSTGDPLEPLQTAVMAATAPVRAMRSDGRSAQCLRCMPSRPPLDTTGMRTVRGAAARGLRGHPLHPLSGSGRWRRSRPNGAHIRVSGRPARHPGQVPVASRVRAGARGTAGLEPAGRANQRNADPARRHCAGPVAPPSARAARFQPGRGNRCADRQDVGGAPHGARLPPRGRNRRTDDAERLGTSRQSAGRVSRRHMQRRAARRHRRRCFNDRHHRRRIDAGVSGCRSGGGRDLGGRPVVSRAAGCYPTGRNV